MKKTVEQAIKSSAGLELSEFDERDDFFPPRNEIETETSMTWWFPKLLKLESPDLNLPKTRIIEGIDWWDIAGMLDFKKPKTIASLVSRLIEITEKEFSWPVFLRTDYASFKYDWKQTCYVTKPTQFEEAIGNLLNETCMVTIPIQALFLREFIKMHTVFIAFYGDMPINREFRFFVKGGAVTHMQPYWPPHAMEGYIDEEKFPEWREALELISCLSPKRELRLGKIAVLAGNAMGSKNEWSVDFSEDIRGKWWLIDMARGECSYRWVEAEEIKP